MPVQLYALTWSNEDRQVIEQWSQEHQDHVMVTGWSRILLEPLHKAAADPNIFGLAIEGVVIRDHTTWPPDTLKEAIKKLQQGTLKLYSVKNGVEPVQIPDPVQY